MQRLHYIDSLRAVASFLIVLYHTSTPRIIGRLGADASITPAGIIGMINDWLEPIRMPLFFMIAGMMCAQGLKKYSPQEFLRKRFVRIVIPFLFAYLFLTYLVKLFWNASDSGTGLNLSFCEYLQHVNPGEQGDLSYLWFLFVLITYTSVSFFVFVVAAYVPKTVALARIVAGKAFGSGTLLILGLVLLELFKIATRSHLPAEGEFANGRIPIGRLFFYANYFFLGNAAAVFLSEYHSLFRKSSFTVALVLLVIVSLVLMGPLASVKFAFPVGAAIINIVPLLLAFSLARRFLDFPSRHLKHMANYSYPVYILHVPLIAGISFLFYRAFDDRLPAFFLIVVIAYPLSLTIASRLCRLRLPGLLLQGKLPGWVGS